MFSSSAAEIGIWWKGGGEQGLLWEVGLHPQDVVQGWEEEGRREPRRWWGRPLEAVRWPRSKGRWTPQQTL